MKVEKFVKYEDGCPAMATFRVMHATCPLCHREVEFAMQEGDFLKEEAEFFEELNTKYRHEIHRLNRIITKLTEKT